MGTEQQTNVLKNKNISADNPLPLESRPEGMAFGEKVIMYGCIGAPALFLLAITTIEILQNYHPYFVDKRIADVETVSPEMALCVRAFYDVNLKDRLNDKEFNMFEESLIHCGSEAMKKGVERVKLVL